MAGTPTRSGSEPRSSAASMARSHTRRRLGVVAGALLAVGAALGLAGREAAPPELVPVVVSAHAGADRGAQRLVEDRGGTVGRRLEIVNGFAARVPRGEVGELAGSPPIRSVTPDSSFRMAASDSGTTGTEPPASLRRARATIGADKLLKKGYTGGGVDVAVIDSGVAPVEGLDAAGDVVDGPDLSGDRDDDGLRSLDTFGHGTHLAGIVTGTDAEGFQGIAPDARLVDVKVATSDGSTSLSQLLAAIGWVVENRDAGDLDIRVLNLSFGAPSDGYATDPLAYAVERAWRAGVVVVASAGNAGPESGGLDSPAIDPYVIAVGGQETNGTDDPGDDTVAPWSSRGDDRRAPDFVAPGAAIVSYRVPGSFLDANYPAARIGARYFRGSGTSQAAAVTSAAAALLLDERPELNPDQVKHLLVSSAASLKGFNVLDQGHGRLDVAAASNSPTPAEKTAKQRYRKAARVGGKDSKKVRLEYVAPDDTVAPLGRRWSGESWSGRRWSGDGWSGRRWSGEGWSGTRWSGDGWSGRRLSGESWSGRRGSGAAWAGTSLCPPG